MNTINISKTLLILLTVFSSLLPTNLLASIEDSTVSIDTVSRKEINIYLAKGLEARKIVIVLRKEIKLDSQIISSKDTIITQYKIINQKLSEALEIKESELALYIKKYQRQKFWKNTFGTLSAALTILYFTK